MNETPSQTVGPFFRFGLDWIGPDTVEPDREDAIELRGVVYDAEGPVPDAMIELWRPPHFARALTEADGTYRALISKPEHDGESAPHIDVSVFARGLLQRLVTRLYFPDEDANSSDPVLTLVPEARRPTLVARREAGGLRFDLHLQGPAETVFFAY